MALTSADLDALDKAIASGTLEVEFDGRRQKFQTTDALIRARDHVARVVNQGTSLNRGPRVFGFRFTTSRGD
jgi:RecB family exonuclease